MQSFVSHCNSGTLSMSRSYVANGQRQLLLFCICRNVSQRRLRSANATSATRFIVPRDSRTTTAAAAVATTLSVGTVLPAAAPVHFNCHPSRRTASFGFASASSFASVASATPTTGPAILFALCRAISTTTASASPEQQQRRRRLPNASTVVAGASSAAASSFVISSSPSCLSTSRPSQQTSSSYRLTSPSSSFLKQLFCGHAHGHRYPRRAIDALFTSNYQSLSSVFAPFTDTHLSNGHSLRRIHNSGLNMVWASDFDVDPEVCVFSACCFGLFIGHCCCGPFVFALFDSHLPKCVCYITLRLRVHVLCQLNTLIHDTQRSDSTSHAPSLPHRPL